MDAKLKHGHDMQYLLFDLGYDSLKVGCYDKDVHKRLNYFTVPTLLYPHLKHDDQQQSGLRQLTKRNLDMACLEVLHGPEARGLVVGARRQ